MTATPPASRPENVIAGAMFALLAIPVGVIALTLLWGVGVVAGIVGFLVAFCAVWLYRRGSGGAISRVGAWTILAIVVVSLVFGLWVAMVVDYAHGVGHLGNIGDPTFWPQFNHDLPDNVRNSVLPIILVFLFGAFGAIRVLGRAFAIARQTPNPANLTGQSTTLPPAPSTYHDDIDAPPTGSADDRTAPPTTGS